MKQEVLIGQTDFTVLVKMRDDAGAPATALAHTDIDIAYARVETDNDVTTTDVTPADLANLTAAHTDWGWEVVSATDHPGLYRLDIADVVFASGAWSAVVTISGTGLDPADLEFVLVAHSPWATLSALDGRIPAALVSGRIDASVGAIAANAITATAIATAAITDSKIADDAFTSAKFVDDFLTAAKIAANAITAAKINDGAIDAATFAAGAINAAAIASAAFTKAKFHADTGLIPVQTGTAQAGSGTTLQLAASGASATDDLYIGHLIFILSGTGAGQARFITDYVGATTTATVAAWVTNPDNTSVYAVLPSNALSAGAIADQVWEEALADHEGTTGSTAKALATAGGSGASAADIADAVWDEDLTTHTTADSAGDILANVAVGSPPTVEAIADEVETRTIAAVTLVNGLAANVITAAATAADFTTEIQSGLATAAALATVDGIVDNILLDTAEIGAAGAGLSAVPWNADWDTEVQSEVTDALNAYDPPTKAELDSGLDALPTAAETAAEVLSAATSAPIAADVQKVNGVTIIGDGNATAWGPS